MTATIATTDWRSRFDGRIMRSIGMPLAKLERE